MLVADLSRPYLPRRLLVRIESNDCLKSFHTSFRVPQHTTQCAILESFVSSRGISPSPPTHCHGLFSQDDGGQVLLLHSLKGCFHKQSKEIERLAVGGSGMARPVPGSGGGGDDARFLSCPVTQR
ncbi:hypothetical protein E2C01_067643 [Portunus trituberculatus]|uniref:Uncharacterized protein n=1 Tax=Portunus trituberculatus TaxID=210409 RepID=A0A5B7HX98_PORTR|nr:hypothetical protein [Portunus trituberculatus]